jgi:ribosome-associated protein
MPPIEIAPGWVIPDEDLSVSFVRSSGPGGQNVNKVATKVELRLRLDATRSLTVGQKQRLRAAFPSHVTQEGDFFLTSDVHRSQSRNQAEAYDRLCQMIRSVKNPPKRRVATKPSKAARRRRLDDKRKRGDIKRGRSGVRGGD